MKKKISASGSVVVLLLFVMALLPGNSVGQSTWENYYIGDSECSADFPFEPSWDFSYADDSSYVWVGETYEDEIYYGVICVEFKVPFYDASEADLTGVLEEYLDYLRGQFNIVSQTGYETGLTDYEDDEATGINDSWVDNEGDPWLVRGWIDPYNLAVLYIYSAPDKPLNEKKDYFFDSFSFPEY